ncbi:MAG: RagB/SusD family nutrient uptake outer membrane protein [Chitinophagaceae bacterium]|nr:MAG: RagB/SusD family nutrient uptake outer membrane protein [Chitinophagaceae bacterium]
MKNKNIWLVLTASLIVGITFPSCKKSFLTVQPTQVVPEEQVATQKGINELLIGAYSDLDGQYNANGFNFYAQSDNWLWGSICGGDAHKGSDPGDQADAMSIADFTTLPTNSYLETRWEWVYDGIARSNNVIRLLPEVKGLTPTDTMNIYAQARFLRGIYAFFAKETWDMVPWVDESVTYVANNYHIANDKDIWPQIEADFLFAYQNLPTTQPAIGMVNRYAAGAFLAKAYMFENKYSQALPVLQDLINNGQTSNGTKYGLLAKFSDNFNYQFNNSSESVFAIQASLNDGAQGYHGNIQDLLNYPYGNGAVTGCCGFFQPSIELVNSFRTDANGLPLLGGTLDNPEYDLPANEVKNDEGIPSTSAFTPDQGYLDPRVDWTAGRRGIPYLDWGVDPGQAWIRNQASAGPYSPKKNVFYKAWEGTGGDNSVTQWAPLNAINYNLIRFAQVLLWAAECEVKAGSLNQAETYVNLVRTRAANPADFVMGRVTGYQKDPKTGDPVYTQPIVDNSQTAANYKISPYPNGWFAAHGAGYDSTAVHFEEKLEFAMEGHRFFDLVRWGEANTVVNHYFQYEGQFTSDIRGAKFTSPTNNYFPIPQQQIDLSNKTLLQNPGY